MTNRPDTLRQLGLDRETEPFIPYGRHRIDEEDINVVVNVLRSDWLTTGPQVDAFEGEFAELVRVREAVAVSSGTAALHAAVHAVGIEKGDEVIVPSLTFVATANAVVYQGATPVFADVDPETLLIDPKDVEKKVTPTTKAIIAVDYAGQPCDYDALRIIADKHALVLIADACHSLGGSYKGRPVGSLADLSCFSFHPVKAITTGEGGMVATDNERWAGRMRTFRNHGITADHRERARRSTWAYEMVALGYNYRITDFQCALGRRQLRLLAGWIEARRKIAEFYTARLGSITEIKLPVVRKEVVHAYHLYVIQITETSFVSRDLLFNRMRSSGIGVSVHYPPVHRHPFYRERFGDRSKALDNSDMAARSVLSLPIYPTLEGKMAERVCEILRRALRTGPSANTIS